MELALEFRDDMEMEEAPPEVEAPAGERDNEGVVAETMARSVTLDMEPDQVVGVVRQLAPEQQGEAIRWLSQHMGMLFASEVAAQLEGDDVGPVSEQVGSLGHSVAAARSEPQLSASASPELEEASDPQYEGKESLATYTDPLLGEFEVLMDLDQGAGAQVTEGVVTVFSASGLILRTPEGMPDVTLRLIRLDLKTGDVEVNSEPELGEFEEKFIGEVLRSTVLSGMVGAESQTALVEQLGLEADADGMVTLHDTFWMSVHMSASTSVLTSLRGEGISLHFSEPIFVDLLGPVNLHIQGVFYDFATGSLTIVPAVRDSMVGQALEQWAAELGALFGESFIEDMLPDAMKEPGYNPARDPNLSENFNALLQKATGATNEVEGGQGEGAVVDAQTSPQTSDTALEGQEQVESLTEGGSQEVEESVEEAPYQSLYTFYTAQGELTLAMDRGDELAVERSATELTVGASGGLYVVSPQLSWLAQLRIFQIRYGLVDGEIEIDASEPVGEMLTTALEVLIRAQVLPRMPGEVQSTLGVGRTTDEVAELGEQELMYAFEVEGFGEVQVLTETSDALRLSKGEEALELSASEGLTLRVVGANWVPDLVVGSLRYELETGEVRLEPPAGGDQALDLGPVAEGLLSTLMRAHLLPLVPGEVKSAVGLGEQEAQEALPPVAGRVVYTATLGSLGELDVSLTDGDTMGLKHSPEGIEVTVAHGLLVRVPQLGVTVRLFELRFDPNTGQLSSRSEPPLGSYEEALLGGALGEFLMPQVQAYLATHDEDLNDVTTVLYRADIPGFGQVRICVEAGDALQVTEDSEKIELSSARGIFWLTEGQASRLLPPNRVERVSMSLTSGEISIDAEQDVGELGEMVATRLVQMMVLPSLDPALRAKIFNGQDPLQSETPETPEAGEVLYSGSFGAMGFDVSLIGGSLLVESTAEGHLLLAASQGSIMLRVPDAGLAVQIHSVVLDPATGQVVRLSAEPSPGPAELGLVERAIGVYVGDKMGAVLGGQASDEKDPLRTVAQVGDVALRVSDADTLRINRDERVIEVSASQGMVIESPMPVGVSPRIEALRYENGTGRVSIAMLNGQSSEWPEVASVTQDLLSALLRQALDPVLSDELRAFGLAGREADGPTLSGEPAPGETVWMDLEAPVLGRVVALSSIEDSVTLETSGERFSLRSQTGMRVVVPGLGVQTQIFSMDYALDTDEVEVDALGQLENKLLSQVGRAILGRSLSSQGVDLSDERGVGAQMRDLQERDKEGALVVASEDGTFYVPSDCVMTAHLSGARLFVSFEPKIWIDGPSVGNFYLDKIEYDFATAQAVVDIDGSNLLSAIFEGIGENKASEALNNLIQAKLPEAMRRPGYNLYQDPNRAENLREMFANFQQSGVE